MLASRPRPFFFIIYVHFNVCLYFFEIINKLKSFFCTPCNTCLDQKNWIRLNFHKKVGLKGKLFTALCIQSIFCNGAQSFMKWHLNIQTYSISRFFLFKLKSKIISWNRKGLEIQMKFQKVFGPIVKILHMVVGLRKDP